MKAWSKEEETFLIDNYRKNKASFVAEKLNRTTVSIIKKARKLKIFSDFYWNEEEIKFLIENHEKMSLEEISKAISRPADRIEYKLSKLGLYKRKKHSWTAQEDEFLINNFSTIRHEDAEKALDKKWYKIYEHARWLGLKRDKATANKLHGESNIGKTRKFYINSEYFDVLTEENLYVLGMLATDGCIKKRTGRETYAFSLGLRDYDRYIIEKINEKMNSSYTIYSNLDSKMCSVVIRDQKMCKRLLELGIVPRKSLILECPNIPIEIAGGFIRGVIDGDGTVQVKKPKVRIYSGSIKFATGLQKIFSQLDIHSAIYVDKSDKNPNYIVNVGRINDVIKLYKLIYKEDTELFLTRKKERFDLIYGKYRS